MNISKRRKKLILDAVFDAGLISLENQFTDSEKEEMESPPEMWYDETKMKFDLWSEFQYEMEKMLGKVLNS